MTDVLVELVTERVEKRIGKLIADERLAIAKRMLKRKASKSLIADVTGLDMYVIEELQAILDAEQLSHSPHPQ